MNASNYGKGARITPKQVRDQHYRLAALPPLAAIDWDTPYKVPGNVPVLNQNGSSSCTAHATVAYCMFLDEPKVSEYSRRFIYSQTFIPPDGGAFIWKAMKIPLKGLALTHHTDAADLAIPIRRRLVVAFIDIFERLTPPSNSLASSGILPDASRAFFKASILAKRSASSGRKASKEDSGSGGVASGLAGAGTGICSFIYV